MALSFPSNKPLRTLLFVTTSALLRVSSKVPYSLMSFIADFGPTPNTPGILSDESPIKPNRSIIFSGGTPQRSLTPSLS